MSLLKVAKVQIGTALSAINNFLFDASPQDGTLTLKRENGQELMKFDSNGKPTFAQLPFNASTNGHLELPNGIILQWGYIGNISGDGFTTVTYPRPFPNAAYNVTTCSANGDIPASVVGMALGTATPKASFKVRTSAGTSGIFWQAIGR
jgi:hypothetical protein